MPTDDTTTSAVPGDDELVGLGVAEAAAAIRNGDITSAAYASALLRRARKNADLNSFITIDESAVLTAAQEADRARAAGSTAPLLGVPIGIKDSYATAGVRTTLGVSNLGNFVPEQDADVVVALRKAGGIVFGKNNLVEMSFGLTGHNSTYGQVKNPYSHAHVPGGSSSGSGAAVAARIVPASTGGDTVGSIRVPASLCGVVGYKPTNGRWPGGGVAPISHTLDTTGILTRSVEDAALLDQIVVRDTSAPPSPRSDLHGIRFAHAPRQYMRVIDPETAAHFTAALQRLRDAGADIVEIDLGDDFMDTANKMTWNFFFREMREAVTAFVARNDFPVTFDEIYSDIKPQLKSIWSQVVVPGGPGYLSDEGYESALTTERPHLQRRLGQVFTRDAADALLFPTTPSPAPLIEQGARFTIAGHQVDDRFLAHNTIPTSGAGLPGISIPIGLSTDGLPIGLEIDAAQGADRNLFNIARRVETLFGALPAPA
ncbi:Asp-tRNA(Asn)/Glu-tRNA(Gln) amidotransferase A subunit family amidase [Streptomyces sp. SAI-135]|jgi:mandelamide amidase|uniref:amidase family protein n=1 Tax=unclassified Streptomyces TaxID=2593676 RepID=UPI002474495E|nr:MULTISPECIES: amidase family protein [unclassified Streptomyces]MDH6522019.1 Asp-tRNA(Asn)/Glu-tRNA(Gln) amidotransferase A subunit family amidase [Streptomyces sp. SAI-090]MDH6573388.1 Asp-tRNA(Asn)/Glu-tRNA(Gln) amidotransferase A subunit family amidase [Streptomyces sp. SAI-117]MDH6613878.1 Asp-tRNA(Asn)/Glu-tRNA(Gln) amidotransferase A subunit family amidase [Streptomyces sp. SAI-135]